MSIFFAIMFLELKKLIHKKNKMTTTKSGCGGCSACCAPGKRHVKLPKMKEDLGTDAAAKARAPRLRISTGRKK